MKLLNQVLLLLLVASITQGCSRPGNTVVEVEPDPFNYRFTAEDAKLIGLQVTDAAGNTATEVEAGVYEFAQNVTPTTPIRFVSNNLAAAQSSFQDVDDDGELSSADLIYNVGFELNYIGNFTTSGERQIFANPLTALIPSTGIPASGIAGLPEQVFEIAIAEGVDAAPDNLISISDEVSLPAKTLISRSVVLLTALQESLVITEGQNAAAESAAIQLMTEIASAGLESGLGDLTGFASSMQNAIELTADPSRAELSQTIASQIATMLIETAPEEISFYEALVATVQENVVPNSTIEAIFAELSTNKFKARVNKMAFSVKLANEIKASGGLATFMNGLFVVPIAVGDNGQSLVDNEISDFNLEFVAATGKVKFNANNAFFDQSELDYYRERDLYGVRVDAQHAVLVTLNANETNLLGAAFEGTNPARLMALCWSEGETEQDTDVCGANNVNLEFYALATNGEICAANYDGVMMEQINSLNRQQISCN